MQHQMSQLQQFHASHRRTADTLQHATWMAGRMGHNPNPMTWDEVKAAANSDRPYAWAFRMIVEHDSQSSAADREIEAACNEDRERAAI